MFENRQARQQGEKSKLIRKKQLFKIQIRRELKNKILNQLRQAALIPSEVHQYANSIPQSIDKLIQYLLHSTQRSQVSNMVIADKILVFLNTELKLVDQQIICPKQLVYLFHYVMVYSQIYQQNFNILLREYHLMSLNWKPDQKQLLLKILIKATNKYKQPKYIKLALQLFHIEKLKLKAQSLKFYDFVMKNYPKEGFNWGILSDHVFKQLINCLEITFYSVEQKIKICQILILALQYGQLKALQMQRLINLFNNLAYLLAYARQHKLLTERVLILIFNLNIDARSKIFLTHPCAQKVIEAMKDIQLPDKLRHLAAESYLSALYNMESLYLPKYIKNYSNVFFSTIEYILGQFYEPVQILQNVKEILSIILQLDNQNTNFNFKQLLTNRQQIMNYLRNLEIGIQLTEQFQFM